MTNLHNKIVVAPFYKKFFLTITIIVMLILAGVSLNASVYGVGSGAGYIEISNGTYTSDSSSN